METVLTPPGIEVVRLRNQYSCLLGPGAHIYDYARLSQRRGNQNVKHESSTLRRRRDRAVISQRSRCFLAATEGFRCAWKIKAAHDRGRRGNSRDSREEQTIWELVSGKIMKSPAAPEKAAEAKDKDEIILTKIPDRSRKAQAPEQLKPTGRWATRAALVKDFEGKRAQEIAYLAETKEDLRNHFEEHPFLKRGCLPMAYFQRRALQTAHRANSRSESRSEFSEELSGGIESRS